MPESNEKTIPVRVALRIRPLVSREVADGCQECIAVTPGEPQVVMGNDKAFTYDFVYGTLTKQSALYEETVLPLLEKLFKGYNATVLAYGQTGSGKTYSMGTSFTTVTNSNDKDIQGVIPRVVGDIFEYVEQKKETEFLLKCSFLEIHNEEIHDLLNPNASSDKISIRENVEGGIKIAGLSELQVSSGEEMIKFLCNGSASRATGATAMNSTSSRSHAIFTIIMEQKDKTPEGDVRSAKFHLVDLAGSERAKRTNAQGERFKEGVNINKGLLSLGNVISALSDENRKSNAHVPYRDSKLTRLLQDSLGGNSNTVMIACVSPADSNYEETLNTLRYADRARQIKNKPIVNRDPVAAEMSRLKQQVQMLQLQLLQGQTINGGLSEGLSLQEVADRVKQLEEENMKLSQELHNSVNQNTTLYEKVLMAELARDKIVRQYDELKHYLTNNKVKLMPSLIESTTENSNEETDLATELQKKFHQFEESCASEHEHNNSQETVTHVQHEQSCEDNASMVHSTSAMSPSMNSSFESQHALRQAELGRQVQELTKALTMKQELAAKMQQTEGAMNEKMLKQYEVTVRDLEAEISKLEQQKAELSQALSAAKNSNNDSDSSKSRLRIKELETKITEMKKKQVELQKLQRLKQQSDSTITKLNTEIQSMKSTRVKLMRQMKEESERFRNLKKEKEKEIMQLKQVDRKRQFEYTKLQNIHQKQQAVLKRKTEEAAAANKRLHDALSKRKEAAEKREKNQNHQNKQSDGLIPRMKSWLSHEVEVLSSISHAKRTLEELIDDRKTISHQLNELREQDVGQPPAKKMFPMKDSSEEEKKEQPENQTSINLLEAELRIKTSQIGELQKKLVNAESNVDKTKHRWNNIHTMAEAKASLHVLLSMAVDANSKQINMEKDLDGTHKELEELRQSTESLVKNHSRQLDFLRSDYDKRVVVLQKEHEDKVLLLLQQLPTEEEKNEMSRLRELIHVKDNELAEKQKENDILQQRFAAFSDALSNETPSIIEMSLDDVETTFQDEIEDEMVIEDVEDQVEDDEDNVHLDPDYVFDPNEPETPLQPGKNRKTTLVQLEKKKKIPMHLEKKVPSTPGGSGCLCNGKCKRNCNCKKNSSYCTSGCRCKLGKCCNRPKDPKTPIVEDSSDSDLSIEKENLSPLVPEKSSLKDSQALTKTVNSTITPKVPEKESKKTIISKKPIVTSKDRENKLQSSNSTKTDKWRKIRRKSAVLSKKQGIRNISSSVTTTPHRSLLRTPGSGFTPAKTPAKTPKSQGNQKKNVNGQIKQRKRKLHNPSMSSVLV